MKTSSTRSIHWSKGRYQKLWKRKHWNEDRSHILGFLFSQSLIWLKSGCSVTLQNSWVALCFHLWSLNYPSILPTYMDLDQQLSWSNRRGREKRDKDTRPMLWYGFRLGFDNRGWTFQRCVLGKQQVSLFHRTVRQALFGSIRQQQATIFWYVSASHSIWSKLGTATDVVRVDPLRRRD